MTKRNPNARRNKAGMTTTEVREAATTTHKHCSWCGEFKHKDEFAPDPRGLLGRAPQCRPCWRVYCNTRSKREDVQKKRREFDATPERKTRMRLAYVKRKYGAAAVQVERRRLAGDPCDVCGRHTERMNIDHSHASGRVRGLLCTDCNVTLGRMNDDPHRLTMLADWVIAHQ